MYGMNKLGHAIIMLKRLWLTKQPILFRCFRLYLRSIGLDSWCFGSSRSQTLEEKPSPSLACSLRSHHPSGKLASFKIFFFVFWSKRSHVWPSLSLARLKNTVGIRIPNYFLTNPKLVWYLNVSDFLMVSEQLSLMSCSELMYSFTLS